MATREESQSSSGVWLLLVAHVPVDGPTCVHVQTLLSGLSGLLDKEKKEMMVIVVV